MVVSIITTAYNSGGTIRDTLLSVSQQEGARVEHIIVDGGSSDDTLDVVREFGHVHQVISEPDHGLYDAMNKGVSVATGDIVCFLNSDDYYSAPDVLREVCAAFRTAGAQAILGDVEYVSPLDTTRVVRRYSSARFTPRRMRWGWMPAHPAFFCRREAFAAVGPFALEYRIAGDFDWMIRALLLGGMHYHYVPRSFVRMRLGGVSTAGWRSTWVLNREIVRACRRHGVYTNIAMLLLRYPAKLTELRF